MQKAFLTVSILITSFSITSSIYLATLEDPNDIQKQLSTTTNAIAIAGTTAIFGLLGDSKKGALRAPRASYMTLCYKAPM